MVIPSGSYPAGSPAAAARGAARRIREWPLCFLFALSSNAERLNGKPPVFGGFPQNDREHATRRYVKQLERLGHRTILEPAAP